uniref:RING-type E3 ubiquitin transferase n=1 Tax=Crocodylus porosus TaxID=8502 RepID=A0A7M4FA83_CROPO
SNEQTVLNSRCPICLERIQNASYLNPCFHGFCFVCIQEWSERKAECPLCMQGMRTSCLLQYV